MVDNLGEGDFSIYLFSMDLDSTVWILDFGICHFCKESGKAKNFFCTVKQKRTHRKRFQYSPETCDERNSVVSSSWLRLEHGATHTFMGPCV